MDTLGTVFFTGRGNVRREVSYVERSMRILHAVIKESFVRAALNKKIYVVTKK